MNQRKLNLISTIRKMYDINFSTLITNGGEWFLDCHLDSLCLDCKIRPRCKKIYKKDYPWLNKDEFNEIKNIYPEDFI